MDGMRLLRLLKLLVLGCGLTLLPAAMALDQAGAENDGSPPAFAGGRMVNGTVTAVAADRLTVKTERGETYQVVTSANTRVRKGRDPIKLADVKVGDGVGAMGEIDAPNMTVHALAIGIVDAEQIKKMREEMGKTWIAGKVTAIDLDALKITVLRQDGVSQMIGLDDDTSFRRGGRGMNMMAGAMGMGGGGGRGGGGNGGGGNRGGGNRDGGGESITLADVKVGDQIGGRGALKNGVFVPTELQVANPPPPGGRQRRQGGNGAGAPPPADGAAPQAGSEPKG
jgi:hypothetical protein